MSSEDSIDNRLRNIIRTLPTRGKQNQAMYKFCKENSVNYKVMEEKVADTLKPYTKVELIKKSVQNCIHNRNNLSILGIVEYYTTLENIDLIPFFRCAAATCLIDYSHKELIEAAQKARQVAEILDGLAESIGDDSLTTTIDWEDSVTD